MPLTRDPYTSMSELDALIAMMPPDVPDGEVLTPEPRQPSRTAAVRAREWRAGKGAHIAAYLRGYRKTKAQEKA